MRNSPDPQQTNRRSQDAVLQDAQTLYAFLSEHEAKEDHADILLIPGSHDLRVADHAAALFLDGRADWLVCSGGFGKITQEAFLEPEAVLFAKRCMQQGVPEDHIVLEPEATNTGENFTKSRAVLQKLGIQPTTGLIVCKPYMARRALATAKKQWPEVIWMVSPAPIAFFDYLTEDLPLSQLLELMTGDLQRLKVYADLGFQMPTPIPDVVWQAYDRLVKDGYDRFVITESI